MLVILMTIIFGLLCLVLTRRLGYIPPPRSASVVVLRHTKSSVTRVLNPLGAPTCELLTARAVPNERLVRAFSLTNTFVSADQHVHDGFVGQANSLLRAAKERGWHHFQEISIQAVQAALYNAPCHLNFDVFIQDVTLRVALVVVTKLITRLWSLSKKPDAIPEDLLLQLNSHLRSLVPDTTAFPNPLDFVIPVWETLWRVVATTVAHVVDDRQALDSFTDMHLLTTQHQFKLFNGSAPSVESIIMESMRLHPPSKHITRAIPPKSLAGILPFSVQCFLYKHTGYPMRCECADIGTLLRSDIWGPDADRFEPLRHHHSRLRPDQEETRTLVFGHGRYRCIAMSWAPMAAGVIVAAVLDRIKNEKNCRLVAGPQIGGRDGWTGWEIITQS